MSSPNLPDGAFFTTINGRRCTAIPREGAQRTTATPEPPTTTTPPPQAPTPPAADTPPIQQPPPQRDPPQAEEPARLTPVNPPARDEEAAPTTARTQTSPSPSSPRVENPPPTLAPAPIRETSRTDEDAAPSQGGQNTPEADLLTPAPTEGGAGSLITTVPFGPGAAESDQAATTGDGFGGGPAVIADGGGGSSGPPVGAIVGGVVGGVAFLTMLALLLWFWRKNRRHRRSTLLTPLSTNESSRFGRKERPYIFDQESVGPTPKAARFRAALGYNIQRVKGQVGGVFAFGHHRTPSGSVLSKGNSYQNITGHSRDSSLVSVQGLHASGALTTKERLAQWKDKFGALAIFGGRGRQNTPLDPDPFAGVMREKTDGIPAAEAGQAPPTGSQTDFLTLLGMDEKAVAREAQRRRTSRRQGSTASMERFLGDLGINIDNSANPFGDTNAIPEDPRRAAPVNPFADSNAIPAAPPAMAMKPGANYIADVRRSRNVSVSGPPTRPSSGQLPHSPRYDSVYRASRASGESVESFATRRNRCRSDPFDLDRPELLSGASSTASGPPRKPGAAHMRSESFASKYSSGVNSAAGWSEPGPDVGADAGVVGGRFSPNSGWRPGAFPGRQDPRRLSDESQESQDTQKTVGKAM